MGLTEYAVDGVAPPRHEAPADAAAVAAVVRDAGAAGEAVVAFGGRTRLEVGNAPARYDVALDLTRLEGIVEHEPGDLTATVRAGTTLAALRRVLEAHGQMWPVEVGRPDVATVGGVLAGAAVGPSRLHYHHPRDWVVGVHAVLGDGTLTKAGGKVVKNVTGYDLARLYAGTYGTLCVIVEASLKLWPLPQTERTLVARFGDAGSADAALDDLRRDGTPLDAAVSLDRDAARYVGEDAPAIVAVRVRGARAAVERITDRVGRALSSGRPNDGRAGLWDDVADVPHRASVVLRMTAPESHVAALLRPARGGILRYHGTGIAFVVAENADAGWIRERRAAVEEAEGSLVVERAPGAVKAELDAWGRPPMPLELARRLKAAFDPRAVLSPGRFAGGI